MLSLQFPRVLSTVSLPNSHYKNKNPFPSYNLECFSRSRLAATSASASDARNDDHELPGELQADMMPKHVALIMDGNGRWAKNRGLPIQHGHEAGTMNLKNIILSCCKLGINVFTIFAFSMENWSRSKVEIDFLMRFIEDFIRKDIIEIIERHGIKFSAIGNRSKLPQSMQSAVSLAEKSSKYNKGMHLVCALSYSGRNDIVDAAKQIAIKVEKGVLVATDIDDDLFGQQLMTASMEFPNPDLLIRTSGELRVSNFMLWQLAYSEFYFSDKLFPDFGEPNLIHAIASFQRRQRRFGQRLNQPTLGPMEH